MNVFASVTRELSIPNATLYDGEFKFKVIWVAGGGDIAVERDGVATTYTDVPASSWFQLGSGVNNKILAATTATGLILGDWGPNS